MGSPLKPLAIDLFCGLGGWTDGLLAAGYRVVGFDIERHVYGDSKYPAQLVLQDVLTICGSQFRDAILIVASSPCQNYSYLAMPWSRSSNPENSKKAKELRRTWEREGPDNRLFDAAFRIQKEASEAAGRHIPLVSENVRGAQPWVGKANASFGSFFLWGDVAQIGNRVIAGRDLADIRAGLGRFGMGVAPEGREVKVDGFRFDGSGRSFQTASVEAHGKAIKTPGRSLSKGGKKFGTHNMGSAAEIFAELGVESDAVRAAVKIGGDWFSDPQSTCRKHGSKSNARKAASALIAKIPYALARYIAEQHYPPSALEKTA